MQIKKFPKQKRVPVADIIQGDCFILLEDIEDRESPCDYAWEEGEIFMSCGYADSDDIYVVHLNTGTMDKFKKDIIVEMLNAHIICE